jgi:hypothetical protein
MSYYCYKPECFCDIWGEEGVCLCPPQLSTFYCVAPPSGLGLGQSIPKDWKEPLGPGEKAKVDLKVVFGLLSGVFGPVLPIRIRTPSARAQEAKEAQEAQKANPKKRPLE